MRTAVLNIVGLSESLLGPYTPHLEAFRSRNPLRRIRPAFPAVTCSAQSNYLTGKTPAEHGIVGNGWFHRELSEVHFWKQSNHQVRSPKIWDVLREELVGFTCANLFWWFNMYSTVDWSVTPRPMYPADGRKIFDIYSCPYGVRDALKAELGEFPFPAFWGPAAGLDSPQYSRDAVSRWIAEAAKWTEHSHSPTLSLVYLPHLDYGLQRFGPGHPDIAIDLRCIDTIAGDLIRFYEERGVRVLILSEYGIGAAEIPIYPNRILRQAGMLTIKEELGLEYLDCGASKAFAVADHQVAHIYLKSPELECEVRALLEARPGIATVLSQNEKKTLGIQHPRAGDLIAVAKDGAWFAYYYWLDEQRAPDFARTVDIHRKPGYDPAELFIDPAIRYPKLKIARRLLQKKLGFRMLMDVVPTDATLIKGTHGNRPQNPQEWPVIFAPPFISSDLHEPESEQIFEFLRQSVMG